MEIYGQDPAMDSGGKEADRLVDGDQTKSVHSVSPLKVLPVPYSDLARSAKCFNNKDLICAIATAKEIYTRLLNNLQPLTRRVVPWKDHRSALCYYGMLLSNEARRRRIPNARARAAFFSRGLTASENEFGVDSWPEWMTDPEVLITHQAFLLGRNSDYYKQVFPRDTPDYLPLRWT